jgi:RNA 2',3'-cyclic 3'-phosphodiesterase
VRLFVGVELDDRVKTAAAQIADSLRRDLGPQLDARWTPAANLHITLWFLGEVDQSRVNSTLQTLDAPFHQPAFDLKISGLGAFPPGGSPRVLWLGVTAGGTALARLHEELTARLASIGFQPESRTYSAHLTIARVKDTSRGFSSREFRALLQGQPADAGQCRVDAVTLFRSRVSPKGATYETLLRVPLE